MSPNPSDVGTTRMYANPGPSTSERIGERFQSVVDGVKDPSSAEGWTAILIPAIVTGMAVALIREWLL